MNLRTDHLPEPDHDCSPSNSNSNSSNADTGSTATAAVASGTSAPQRQGQQQAIHPPAGFPAIERAFDVGDVLLLGDLGHFCTR